MHEQGQKKVTILLVDDHAIFRQGLRSLLEVSGFYNVVGEADRGEEAVSKAAQIRPDIVIMDIAMPGMDGMEATRRIKEILPGVKILILSMYSDSSYTREVLQAGAAGFASKGEHFSELVMALECILKGKPFISPSVLEPLLEDYKKKSTAGGAHSLYGKLSTREKEVFSYMARGCRRQEISEKLFISPKTVDKHRIKIKEKLNIHSELDLLRFAELIHKL